ncbi:MAG TPA: hydrolase [Nitrospiria bacterium]|nr:hydrolase [Nitrospiria bacterium]
MNSDRFSQSDNFDPFRPAWWLRNAHAQTAWRRLFGDGRLLPYRRERVETPDGDFVDLDWLRSDEEAERRPLALILHGLEGCSRAKYVVGLMKELSRRGWDGVAMNFRSCSGELNRLPRFYHSGETEDLDIVVSRLVGRFPGRPIAIVGYSLGGNVLLKWLGERGGKIPDAVRGAATVSVPFDLEAAAERIDRGVHRIYGRVFLSTLKPKVIAKAMIMPGLIDREEVARIRTFAEFDDRVTAPIHGFASGRDYWRRTSSGPFLPEIRRPTLLINACDDPFLPETSLPIKAVAQSRWLEADFPKRGGHVGFVEGSWPGSASYWIDRRVMAFLDSIRFRD